MAKRKPLAPLRVPKGVPSPIRRQLRLGKPGQFMPTVKALQLFDWLTFAAEDGQKSHDRLLAKFETVKRPETKAKYLGLVRDSQAEGGGIYHALNQLAEEFGVEPSPPLASPDVVPTIPDLEEPGEDFAQPEEGALEVEFGIDYLEAEGWYHQHGDGSDVSFNARIFRQDGRPLTESDAREVAMEFASSGEMPGGIEVRTVKWSNTRGERTRRGIASNDHDLRDFQRILRRVGDSGLRIGLVKPDEL